MTAVMQTLQAELPNLEIAYISSRTYGGYNDVSSPSPEPTAYEEGFGVKWLIERQMNGEAGLNADPAAGEVDVPWLAWGPYMWADGTSARQDGLLWDCRDYRGDGVHPEGSGNDKIAALIMDFLEEDPTAAWAFTGQTLPDAPTDGTLAPPTTVVGAEDVPEVTIPPEEERSRDRERPSRSRDDVTTTVVPDDPNDEPTDDTATPDTTSAPEDAPPTDDREETAAARTPEEGDGGDGASPLIWVLLGAGGALVLVALAGWANRRRTGQTGPSEPPTDG